MTGHASKRRPQRTVRDGSVGNPSRDAKLFLSRMSVWTFLNAARFVGNLQRKVRLN